MATIAVIGGTGMLGKPVALELLKAGHKVKIIARDPEKARKTLPGGFEFLQGDLNNKKSIEVGLNGCDAVYLNLQVDKLGSIKDWSPEREGLETVLQVGKASGIKQVLYLSSIIKDDPAQQDFWVYQIKKQAAEKIEKSGIPFTIFCPSCFMENLSELQIQGEKLMHISKTNSKNYWISGQDFGKMVAKAVLNPSALNKTYWIQGPEALSLDQVSNTFVANYQKKTLKIQGAPLGVLKIFGLFSKDVRFMTKIMSSVVNMPEPFQGQNAWNDLGKPEETVSAFAKRVSKI